MSSCNLLISLVYEIVDAEKGLLQKFLEENEMFSPTTHRLVMVTVILLYDPVKGQLDNQISKSSSQLSSLLQYKDDSAKPVNNILSVTAVLGESIHLQLRIIYDGHHEDGLISLMRFTPGLRGTTVTSYEAAKKDLNQNLTPTADEAVILLLCSSEHILEIFQLIKTKKIWSMRAYWLLVLWSFEEEVWLQRELEGLILEGTRIGLITRISRGAYGVSTSYVDMEGVTRIQQKAIMNLTDVTDNRKREYLSRILLIDNSIVYSNMDGRRLKVTSHPCPVFTFVGPSDENGIVADYHGIDFSILKALSLKLNFTFDVYENFGYEWGDRLRNGSVTGFIGKVHRREMDLAVAHIAITQSRATVVDYTVPVFLDNLGILSKAPTVKNPTFIAFSPFTMTVWSCIIATLLLLGPFLKFLSMATELLFGHSSLGSLQVITFTFFRVIVIQGNLLRSQSSSHRVILGFWYIFCVIISALYSGILVAVLAIPSYEKPIDSLNDLPRAVGEGFTVGVHRQTVMEFLFRKADSGIYRDTWMLMNQDDMSKSLPYFPFGYDWVTQKKFAIIEAKASMEAEATIRGFRRHYISKEYFFLMWVAFACKQGAPYREQFDRLILRLIEGGLVYKYKDDEFRQLEKREVEEKEKEGSGPAAIKLIHLQAAFYILFLGNAVSVTSFVIELVFPLTM